MKSNLCYLLVMPMWVKQSPKRIRGFTLSPQSEWSSRILEASLQACFTLAESSRFRLGPPRPRCVSSEPRSAVGDPTLHGDEFVTWVGPSRDSDVTPRYGTLPSGLLILPITGGVPSWETPARRECFSRKLCSILCKSLPRFIHMRVALLKTALPPEESSV